MWQDLWPNLLAEFIGFIVTTCVTIFGINQLLKWRERRRWNQIKSLVLGRIQASFSRLLGEIAVTLRLQYPAHLISGLNGSLDFVEYARNHLEDFREGMEQMKFPDWLAVDNALQQCLHQIRETTDTYNILLEPDLLTPLFRFEESLSGLSQHFRLSAAEIGDLMPDDKSYLARSLMALLREILDFEDRLMPRGVR